MDIITTARHFDLTPGIRDHARKRIEKLERYLGGVEDVHVILTTEKHRRIAEISLRARGTEVVGRDESDDMITSIDRVVDRIERQLQRLRARRRDRKPPRGMRREVEEAAPLVAEEISDEEDSEALALEMGEEEFAPVVVPSTSCHSEPVSVEEAIRIMRDRDEDLLLFTNAQTRRPAMVHLRPDGNYGFVELP